jgi:hypothetical protein
MRSELVYRANDKVQNRFQLCCLTSFSARKMNQSSVSMHTTINRALTAISAQTAFVIIEPPSVREVKAADEVGAPAPVFDPAV